MQLSISEWLRSRLRGGCNMKNLLKKIPVLNTITKILYFTIVSPSRKFAGSENYWKQRYKSGGTSGSGSYKKLAEFKAEVLNDFVKGNRLKTIIEYGCGDGNQLRLSNYPSYIGFDVSQEAISNCKAIFADDGTKTFKLMETYENETAQLTLSLDVIYHLIEEDVFLVYMKRLFESSQKFVIIYSSNTDKNRKFQAAHVKHRKFTEWIDLKLEWTLVQHIPNRYPYNGKDNEESLAEFFIYEKI